MKSNRKDLGNQETQMSEHLELYNQLLSAGRYTICSKQKCGEYKKQLQDLHDFVYVVESTPNPCEPEYSPMFLDCIVHKSLWTPELKTQLKEHYLSFNIVNYYLDTCVYYHISDTEKRRLLFEMMGKWWFFEKSPSPALALSEAIEFRNTFFRQEFAYLPNKFRRLVAQKGFCQAIEELTEKEHSFLNEFVLQMKQPSVCCGCVPIKKTAFSSRLDTPVWYEVPELDIYEKDNVNVKEVEEAVLSGDFLYLVVYNFHDGLDRSLYTTLYSLFSKNKQQQNNVI